MKISIAPILYYWPKQTVLDFYQQLLAAPVDTVYLGETVCSKRNQMRTGDWIDLAQQLAETGVQVVLSTLALIEAPSELRSLQKICDNSGKLWVEANDMAAVQLMAEKKLAFVCGPSINIYNGRTLKFLHNQGMRRWVMPVELNRGSLIDILAEAESMGFADQIETEVFAYGHLPLAYSARCFTARLRNLPKDGCLRSCIHDPEGLLVESQEGQELFTLNGIQTLSGYCYNLLPQLEQMRDIGVDLVRISPPVQGVGELIKAFKQAIDTGSSSDDLIARQHCNGYWFGEAGINRVEQS